MDNYLDVLPYSGKLQGQVIGCTGDGPYEEDYIKDLIRNELGIPGDKDIWQQDQVIVIGRAEYDKTYLQSSFAFGKIWILSADICLRRIS